MSLTKDVFDIKQHIINAAHIREFPRATTSGYLNLPPLKIVINQYVPKNYTAKTGDISIIFCHANGFHKELYEPFFCDLVVSLRSQGVGIRGIWAPDAAHQGASGVLNEKVLGDHPCWNDLPRDVLHLVNTFAEQLPPPLIGMGHSYGGHAIVKASLMHPSLFTAAVLVDPVIEEHKVFQGSDPAKASSRRRDTWASREEAEGYFRSRAFYKQWDPRCLELHMKHGLRELPTHTYPDKTGFTLTTTKHQEVFTFLKNDGPVGEEFAGPVAAAGDTFRKLHEVVVPVLYIVGGDSPVSTPISNKRKMERTRGAEMISIPGTGHLVPLEKPTESADVAAPYLKKHVENWKSEAEKDRVTPRAMLMPKRFIDSISKL
ncbi:Alpha/beta hydrolase family-domain-containing protein [Pyronema domesticum]|uniref:Similar to Peroxisomal membrane protein LPX1 acc. no. Q12405 n=1 Tax=Pyronema omphalodes (strain CBS 100304) TaxID=1076935 RepID=U4LED0_PYROM|nr:Alpha/beta hydrolase family-domain-containing protein [Pyronema domesticum]CCX13110.1 Similar to Peroxisomal membrane protein LPX1; acc. no. Q12405 [Pyronema omphalodes CBS 100304]